jgi:hypothetical protein
MKVMAEIVKAGRRTWNWFQNFTFGYHVLRAAMKSKLAGKQMRDIHDSLKPAHSRYVVVKV